MEFSEQEIRLFTVFVFMNLAVLLLGILAIIEFGILIGFLILAVLLSLTIHIVGVKMRQKA